jgi:hypothetical protein
LMNRQSQERTPSFPATLREQAQRRMSSARVCLEWGSGPHQCQICSALSVRSWDVNPYQGPHWSNKASAVPLAPRGSLSFWPVQLQ